MRDKGEEIEDYSTEIYDDTDFDEDKINIYGFRKALFEDIMFKNLNEEETTPFKKMSAINQVAKFRNIIDP